MFLACDVNESPIGRLGRRGWGTSVIITTSGSPLFDLGAFPAHVAAMWPDWRFWLVGGEVLGYLLGSIMHVSYLFISPRVMGGLKSLVNSYVRVVQFFGACLFTIPSIRGPIPTVGYACLRGRPLRAFLECEVGSIAIGRLGSRCWATSGVITTSG